ncbi:3-phosphoshikimate 1-carboxyvinyltransferase [bacterium]|nr:3-phosphoshikimate 1-carboxyvinyltransferase [bacterium]
MIRLSGLVPDKSISHRAAILASMADGESRIENFSAADDCLRTLAAVEQLGVPVQRSTSALVVSGGVRRFAAPSAPLDLGNSGTGLRLLLGLLAGQAFRTTLTGDESLRSRPMDRVARPLMDMGARLEGTDGFHAPVTVTGARPLKGISWKLVPISAQVKSAILIATCFAEGETTILEPVPTRDHTERMLTAAGIEVRRAPDPSGLEIRMRGGLRPNPFHIRIPGDFSAAAFFAALGILSEKIGGVEISDIGLNPTRTAFLDVARLMGAPVETRVDREECGEPVGTLTVRPGPLRGIEIPREWIPNLIDELPIISVLAARASGTTVVRGAEELRVKESDRIKAIVEMLRGFSVDCSEREDGFSVTGGPALTPVRDRFKTFADHRIAMSVLIAAASSGRRQVQVDNTECINTSFPKFFDVLRETHDF